MKRKRREGAFTQEQPKDDKEKDAAIFLQRRMRGIIARKNIEVMRQKEMEFLGMCRRPKTAQERVNDPIERMKKIRQERKLIQVNNWTKYNDAKEEIKNEIDENQGVDIREQMLKERREWVNEQKKLTYKLPEDCKGFYERFNVEAPLSPEEEAAKAAEEEEAAKAKGKKKGDKKKEGKKKGKKKKGDADEGPPIVKIGITEAV